MKQTEKFISHACMYTVFISIAFYIFSNFVNSKGLSMTFSRFITILAFSMVTSSMEFVFSVTKFPTAVKYLIHYATLCVAFNVVFFTIRKASTDFVFSASTVFAATILFTFGYAFVILSSIFVRKLIGKSEKEAKKKSAPSSYTPRFK